MSDNTTPYSKVANMDELEAVSKIKNDFVPTDDLDACFDKLIRNVKDDPTRTSVITVQIPGCPIVKVDVSENLTKGNTEPIFSRVNRAIRESLNNDPDAVKKFYRYFRAAIKMEQIPDIVYEIPDEDRDLMETATLLLYQMASAFGGFLRYEMDIPRANTVVFVRYETHRLLKALGAR